MEAARKVSMEASCVLSARAGQRQPSMEGSSRKGRVCQAPTWASHDQVRKFA